MMFWRSLWVWLITAGLVGPLHASSTEDPRIRMELARQDLRISEVTAARIAADLDQLRSSGNASPEVIKDYEIYLARVNEMVTENRKILGKMQAAYSKHMPSESIQGLSPTKENRTENTQIPEEKAIDELAALDHQFNDSLAQFDEMLLKELDWIRSQSSRKMTDLAEEAAAAAQRLRDRGVPVGTTQDDGPARDEATQEEGEAEEESTDREEGGMVPQGEATETEIAGTDDASAQGKGATPAPAQRRRLEAHDDDIVARQLREAAERETDPELKEKLWKEYEEYKKGRSQ